MIKSVVNGNTLFVPLHITTKHTGKMNGFQSLSTCCINNPNCARYRHIKGGICEKCFAFAQFKYHTNNISIFERNGEILSSHKLTAQEIPNINALYFRFECFGDLFNVQHFENYCLIAEHNPQTNFTLWTKNGNFINTYVKQGNKIPKNLNIVLSSFKVNEKTNFTFNTFKYKVFTVYDKEHAKDVTINCGAKSCANCLLCYKKNNITEINEILK